MTGDRPALVPWATVERLKGIGPRLASDLAEVGVARVVDLLLHLPTRYEDRCQRVTLDQTIDPGSTILVWGKVDVTSARWGRRRGMKIVEAIVDDGRGRLAVVWFNQPWIERRLGGDRELSLYGTTRTGPRGALQLVNPEVNEIEDGGGERIVPVYRRLGPLGGRRLRRMVDQALGAVDQCVDPLPDDLRQRLGLAGLGPSLELLHEPEPVTPDDRRRDQVSALCEHRTEAHRRLAFDELLAFACSMADRRSLRLAHRAPVCTVPDDMDRLAGEMFRFRLTSAQRRVVGEIAADMAGDRPMARLIQGDVGCGKTAVAAMAVRIALESGYQAALMAPTEILAEQHHRSLRRIFTGDPFGIELLTSSLPAPQRERVLEGLAAGSVPFVTGTHALIQEGVRFANLGLVVVDEQHRFGVSQRRALSAKGEDPHALVMTATPIPRTLALTVYGDLELSVIDEMPPGRAEVTTVVREATETDRFIRFLTRELAGGGRAFFVFPMIDPNEDRGAPALQERAERLRRHLPGVHTAEMHGRMSQAERERVAELFRTGEVQVVFATTVVEVGIDVPEASVIVIEGAERFGLSQLHQLRGRVGRGNRRSWCVLIPGAETSDVARHRLEVMCRTTDGFEIAEADLELRGPGELTGMRQWGPAGFRFANLVRHRDLIAPARDIARELDEDGRLGEVHEALLRYHPHLESSG